MQRQLSGMLVVDKPEGMTSAKVVAKVKSLTHAGKVGHTGTLDPFATGVLICCLNQATRLARFFLDGNKTYRAVVCLGIDTDTQDFTGNVISRKSTALLTAEAVVDALKSFEGDIEQRPPVYSALKHQGIPLYRLARSGNPVQKPARRVCISSIRVIDIRLPEVTFDVSCSAGTYIRTLCADVGAQLGCGGHLKALRRLASSGFEIENAITLETLKNVTAAGKLREKLVPMADALPGMKQLTADRHLANRIQHGRTIAVTDISEGMSDGTQDFIKIVDRHKQLLAIVKPAAAGPQYDYCCVFSNEHAK